MSQRARILWVIVLAIAPLVVLSGVGLWQPPHTRAFDMQIHYFNRRRLPCAGAASALPLEEQNYGDWYR